MRNGPRGFAAFLTVLGQVLLRSAAQFGCESQGLSSAITRTPSRPSRASARVPRATFMLDLQCSDRATTTAYMDGCTTALLQSLLPHHRTPAQPAGGASAPSRRRVLPGTAPGRTN